MRYFMKGIIFSISMTLISNMTYATEEKKSADWLSNQKTCDQQWTYEQNGHHRHVGKAVCACVADLITQFKTTHQYNDKNSTEYQNFYKQATQICTTNGILANTIDRSVFDRVSDSSTIETICTSSWVGLMGSFHPADPHFDSAKICKCASPKLTEIVADFDNLTPKDIRMQSLALVKKCDPSAALSTEEFTLLNESTKAQASISVSEKGKFILEIKDDPEPKYNDIAKYLRKDGRLNDIVAALNQTLKIPYDIKIVATTTNAGPYYTYKDKTISLDYKIMNIVLKLYDKYHANEPPENRRHYFNNLNRYFLYHELGHALIDAYHLPVLGQEEDGADALSAVISLKYLPKGFQVLVDAADFYYLLDKVVGTDASAYWDEHDLNKQRYYRLLCFAYGKNPKAVEQKIEHYYKSGLNTFIKERSDYCHDEYETTYLSWMYLLQPYLKTDSKASTKTQEVPKSANSIFPQ